MFKLTPEQEERVQIKSTMWAQLAEGYGARSSSTRLQELFALHDCITAYESAELMEAYTEAMARGSESQAQFMADDYHRGVVDTYRRLCGDWGCAVPAWVDTLAAEIAQRRSDMKTEITEHLQTMVSLGEQVH